MLWLRTFGTVLLERDGEVLRGAAAQRRVLALLTLLAAARKTGLSRDRVIGLLWPEREPDRARQALAQALYHARRAVGQDDLFLASGDLRLNDAVITTDVGTFQDALEAGDLERAVGLYHRPFLDGFYVGGNAEFEQWASAERARLEKQCAKALEQLAESAERDRDYRAAVEWRRQLATIDPLNSRVALALMETMAAAGDRAGALQYAHDHERLLREEWDLEPDPVLVESVRRLREPAPWTPPAVATGATSADATLGEAASTALAREQHVHDSAAEPARDSRMRATWRLVPVILVLVAAVAIWTARTTREPSAAVPSVPGLIVVAPFRTAGADASLAFLGEGMVDLLVTKLTEDNASSAADPGSVLTAWRRITPRRAGAELTHDIARQLARGLGGERLLMGSVVGTPSQLVISASLLDVRSGDVRAQATVEGGVDSVTVLVDRLTSRLLASEAGDADRLASRTSTSLGALRAFLDGKAAYRRGAYRAAIGHFQRALELDSAFAMAGLGLTQAAERIGESAERERGMRIAWRGRDELSERDRLYVDALTGPEYPHPASEREQLAAWERVSTLTPGRADVWHELGERLFYHGQSLGVRDWRERAAAAFTRAAELDPDYASPWQYLLQLAAAAGDTAAVRQRAAQYLQRDSAGDLAGFVRWRRATALRDSSGIARARDDLSSMHDASLHFIVLASLYHAIEGSDAERSLEVLGARAARGHERREVLLGAHALAVSRGRSADARAHLDALEALDPSSVRAHRLRILDALYGQGDTAVARRSAARLAGAAATAPNDVEAVRTRCALAQWRAAVAASSSPPIATAARGLERTERETLTLCDAVAAARSSGVSHTNGNPPALQRLDSLALHARIDPEVRAYIHLAVARANEARGDVERGLSAVRRRPYMHPWPRYRATALLLEARLASRLGDVPGAIAAYEQFLGVQHAPDAAWKDVHRQAQTELDRLRRVRRAPRRGL